MMSYQLYTVSTSEALPVCQKSWGSGSIGFGCLDCEADSQCIICPECFFNGDHDSHRVRLVHTSGGCCDCGDASSWKPSGFCRLHQGVSAEEERKISVRPELLAAYVEAGEHLKQLLIGNRMQEISDLLSDLTTRSLASREFLTALRVGALEISRLTDIIKLVNALPTTESGVCEKFSDFFLSLMQMSPCFKLDFGRVFARLYSESMRNASLASLTVQLFTIPSVAETLALEEGLLDTVVTNLMQSLAGSQSGLSFPFWRVVHDLKYLLQHRPVFAYLMTSPVLARLVECVRKIHHENFQLRIVEGQDHVVFESQTWRNAFKHEELMLDALEISRHFPSQPLYDALVARLPPSQIGQRAVSMHIPMIRLLVLLGRDDAAKAVYDADANKGDSEKLGEQMIEECGAVLKMIREIEGGKWVRNGMSMEIQSKIYKGGIFETNIAKISYYGLDLLGLREGLRISGLERGLRQMSKQICVQDIYAALYGEISDNLEVFVVQTVGGRGADSFGALQSLAPKETDETMLEEVMKKVCERGACVLSKEGWQKFDVLNWFYWKSRQDVEQALEEATRHEINFPIKKLLVSWDGSKWGRTDWMQVWFEASVFTSEDTEIWFFGLGLLHNLAATVLEASEAESIKQLATTYWTRKPSLGGNGLLKKLAEAVLAEGRPSDDREAQVDRKSAMRERQLKLAAVMQSRQAAFVAEDLGDSGTSERVCMVCREGSGSLGFACFILPASQGGTVASCGHEFHETCWRSGQHRVDARFLNFQENEQRCPVCRSLSNFLISENPNLGEFNDEGDSVEVFLAKAVVKDVEISMRSEPAKCLNWGSYPPVFARLLRLLGRSEEISDPKLALVLRGEVTPEVVGDLLRRGGVGEAEFLTFSCWVSIALNEAAWSDAARNSVAFISSAEQPIAVLRGLLGLEESEICSMEIESEIACMKFPDTILEAIKDTCLGDRKCRLCGTLPEEPAVCVVCDEVFCIGCAKCRSSPGECTAHAKECKFRGLGIFLMPFSASVAFVTPRRSGLWAAPYVDSRGETDQGLRRSVKLRLDVGRAEKLKLMVLRGTLDVEIVRDVDKVGSYVPTLL